MNDNAAHEMVDEHGYHVHVVPRKVLIAVFAALLVLTWLTVAATRIDLGSFNIWLALLIAVVKASVVGLYFMHLRYDSPFYGFVLMVALLFVAIFLAAAITDSMEYQPRVTEYVESRSAAE